MIERVNTRTYHSSIEFNGRLVGSGAPCYVIAEIGSNFNGDLDAARRSIDAAVSCGVDAVKFQTFKAEEFVADRNLTYTYTLPDGKRVRESQYDMFKRLELPDEWHEILRDHAISSGVHFMSSAADRAAVDLLDGLNVPALKFASEDLINIELLEYAATRKRPVILSTGMADEREIELALNIFRSSGNEQIVLLHCTSSYPTPPESCNLRRIASLQRRFAVPVGFSDHTIGWEAPFASVAMGACIIEKHFTLDRQLPGPDHQMSTESVEFGLMVRKIRDIEIMLGSDTVDYDPIEEDGRIQFRRSIVAGRDIDTGEEITKDMLAYKRPGGGLKPYEQKLILGKRAIREITKNKAISIQDLE